MRKRRPIPFLDDFEKKWSNNGVWNGLHGAFGKETVEREDEQSQKVRGKTEKDFKNCPHCAKHAFFVAEVSRQIHSPKHFKTKVSKNFLSVFRDWKSHSRGSCEMSRENLCVPLATRPSTREQVAKIDPRAPDYGIRLDLPATESPKQGKNDFWNFQFLKNKTLSKNT